MSQPTFAAAAAVTWTTGFGGQGNVVQIISGLKGGQNYYLVTDQMNNVYCLPETDLSVATVVVGT